MADEKPTAITNLDAATSEHIVTLLAMLILAGAIASAILAYLESLVPGAGSFWEVLASYFMEHIWPVWKIFALIISGLSLWGIIHNIQGINAVAFEENKIFGAPAVKAVVDTPNEEVEHQSDERWVRILELINTKSSSDWRLAVLEADVMLEDLLRTLKLPGDSIGEMLKATDPNEFSTLDEAWEAHKIRNE